MILFYRIIYKGAFEALQKILSMRKPKPHTHTCIPAANPVMF
jgi:hypothetical protein